MLIGGGGGGFPSIPGDPSGIRSAATQIGQLAAQVGSQGAVLTNTAGGIVGSAWTGTAANQFESMIGTFGGVHREVDSSLGALAGALSQFASVLQACQEQMAQAQANMSSAQQDAQSGAAQVDATMPESEAASDPGMAQDRAAALASVSDEYSARSQQATNLAGDANDRYQAAVSALQGHLSQASADGHQTSSVVSGIGNALGIPNTVVAALATVAMARSASRFVTLAPEFDAALAREFDEVVGPAGLAFDRGEISLADLSDAADSFLESAAGAGVLFHSDAVADLASGGVRSLGGFAEAGGWVARGAGVLGIVGDYWTFTHPDEGGAWGTVEQGSAAVNGVATGGLMTADALGMTEVGGVLATDATLGWVPVAGQVLVLGTGLFMAGDYLYTHEAWFRDGVDTVGHAVSGVAEEVWNLDVSEVHLAGSVMHDVGSTVVSGAESAVSGAESVGSTVVSGASDVAHFLGL